MSDIRILKKQEKEDFILSLEDFYDCKLDNIRNNFFYLNENTLKVNMCNIEVETLNLPRVNNFGIYFGTFHSGDRFRLSLEGSKFIIPKRNYVLLNEKGFKNYIAGENVISDEVEKYDWQDNCPFLIVLYNSDRLGSVNLKDGVFLTYLPKSRKLDHGKVF